MIYMSVAEYAKYRGYTDRRIRQMIAAGEINAGKITNQGKMIYRIPVTELPVAAQYRWYRDHGIDPPDPAQSSSSPDRPIIAYDDLTDAQRAQAEMWRQILEEWDAYCAAYNGRKCDANEAYAAQVARKYAIDVSVKTLYRKRAAYKAAGISGLVDMRGRQSGSSVIDEALWQCFLWQYLDQAQHPIKACYDYTRMWAEQEHPELLPLPSYSAFYRRVQREIPLPVRVLGRCGDKAYRDRCGLYIRRKYDDMASNEWWIADNHTIDVMVRSPDGKLHRPYLTAFYDARSGIFVGCYITNAPSSQATIYALRKGIEKYGIPDNIYVDNGREFLTRDVGGLGHRRRKNQQNTFDPPPIFERLGIKMTNALVRNARAKIIERRFRDIKDRISRLFGSYTGGNVTEKPERLKQVLKSDRVPTDGEFAAQVEAMLTYYINEQPYGGSVMSDRGKTRMQVYQENLQRKRVASAQDLDLMLMRSSRAQKVGRRGVHLTVAGTQIDYYNDDLLLHWIGKQVYLRYDPADLSYVRVYDLDNRYITTAACDNQTILTYGAAKDDVQAAVQALRRQERLAKAALASLQTGALGSKQDALSIVLAQAERNKTAHTDPTAKIYEIHTAADETAELPEAVGGSPVTIDKQRMIRNLEMHKDHT